MVARRRAAGSVRASSPSSRSLIADLGWDSLVGRVLDQPHQLARLGGPLRPNDPELGQMAAQRVDVHGLLLDQQLADPMQLTNALLLDRLDRNKAHRRPGDRLGDRLGIGGIVLVALDVRLT